MTPDSPSIEAPSSPPPEQMPEDWPRRFAVYAFNLDGYDALSDSDQEICQWAGAWAWSRIQDDRRLRAASSKGLTPAQAQAVSYFLTRCEPMPPDYINLLDSAYAVIRSIATTGSPESEPSEEKK